MAKYAYGRHIYQGFLKEKAGRFSVSPIDIDLASASRLLKTMDNPAPPPAGGIIVVTADSTVAERIVAPLQASPLLSITAHGSTIEEARREAMAQARREALAKNMDGTPELRGESYSGRVYSGLFAFRTAPSSDGDEVPKATSKAVNKPSWILIAPAELGDDGRAVWGGRSAWARAWLVPAEEAGMRMIATIGDADDHDLLTASHVSDPDDPAVGHAVQKLARKYAAPAIAIVRLAPEGTAIDAWLWRGGRVAVGHRSVSGSPEAVRTAALALLVDLTQEGAAMTVPGNDKSTESPIGPQSSSPAQLHVTRHPTGSLRFKLWLATLDPSEQTSSRRTVSRLPGITLKSVRAAADGYEMAGEWGGGGEDALRRALNEAGLPIER